MFRVRYLLIISLLIGFTYSSYGYQKCQLPAGKKWNADYYPADGSSPYGSNMAIYSYYRDECIDSPVGTGASGQISHRYGSANTRHHYYTLNYSTAPVCEAPLINDMTDWERKCIDDPNYCETPDSAFPALDPDSTYSPVSYPATDDPITCTDSTNYSSIKETETISCVIGERCKFTPLDSDDDGVPNVDDPFPNDPNESSDSDNDGVGDEADTDDDNDGYSDQQEINENTDPTDPNDNGGTNGTGSAPDGGGANGGGGGSGGDDEYNQGCSPGLIKCGTECILDSVVCNEDGTSDGTPTSHDCAEGYTPASDYATSFNCDPIEPEEETPPNDCSLLGSYGGYSNSAIVGSYTECRVLQNSNGGFGNSYFLANCNLGSVACYYGSNDTENDSNASMTDSNGSVSELDLTPVVNGLSQVKSEVALLNTNMSSKLDSINNNISFSSDKTNASLDSLRIGNNQNSRDIQGSVNNLSNRLAGGLSGLQTTLNSIDGQLHNEGSVGFSSPDKNSSGLGLDGEKVSDIYSTVATIKDDLGDAKTLFESAISEFGTFTDNLTESFETLSLDLESYKVMFSNTPTVDLPSGGACPLSVALWGTNVDYGANLCVFLQKLSPFMVYVLFISTQLSLIFIALRLFSK